MINNIEMKLISLIFFSIILSQQLYIFIFFRNLILGLYLPTYHAFLLNAEASNPWDNCYGHILLKCQENTSNK